MIIINQFENKNFLLINFVKRGMKNTLVGTITVYVKYVENKAPCLISYKTASELSKQGLKENCIRKLQHGGAIILPPQESDKVFASFDTSKPTSFIFGQQEKNIRINEDLNPIEYKNKFMEIKKSDIINYFYISNDLDKYVMASRYASNFKNLLLTDNEKSDMLYLQFHALMRVLTSEEEVLSLETRPIDQKLPLEHQEESSLRHSDMIVDRESTILTPSETRIHNSDRPIRELVDKGFCAQLYDEIMKMENDNNSKEAFYKSYVSGYGNILNDLYNENIT